MKMVPSLTSSWTKRRILFVRWPGDTRSENDHTFGPKLTFKIGPIQCRNKPRNLTPLQFIILMKKGQNL